MPGRAFDLLGDLKAYRLDHRLNIEGHVLIEVRLSCFEGGKHYDVGRQAVHKGAATEERNEGRSLEGGTLRELTKVDTKPESSSPPGIHLHDCQRAPFPQYPTCLAQDVGGRRLGQLVTHQANGDEILRKGARIHKKHTARDKNERI